MVEQDYFDQASQTQGPAEAEPTAQQPAFSGAGWQQEAPQMRATYTFSPVRPAPRSTGRRELLLAGFALLLCAVLWDCLLWANGLGIGEALSLGGILPAAALYQRRNGKKLTAFGVLTSVLFAAGAVSLALSGDSALKALTLPLLFGLFILRCIERMDLWTGERISRRFCDFFAAIFYIGFGRMDLSIPALFRGENGKSRGKKALGILAGAACAIPALIVLVPLLVSSDAAFEALIERMDLKAVLRGLVALAFGIATSAFIFTLLFTSDQPLRKTKTLPFQGADPAAIVSFLSVISLAYVLYLISQFAYFTGAFRGLLPKDYTVAQYARRGFFEMCVIVAINLGLILLATKLCRKSEGRLPGAVTGLAAFLCVFSLVLTFTALSKMVLYVQSFGLTRLRILTSVFIVFLAAVNVAVLLRLFLPRIPALRFAVVLGSALLIVLSLANVDGIVARYNVEAYRSGKLDGLDMSTICELDDGAVPSLVELIDDKNPEYAAAAREELRHRLSQHGLSRWDSESGMRLSADKPADLRSWNLVSGAARRALERVRDRLLPYDPSSPSLSNR